jgi:predicted deacylase
MVEALHPFALYEAGPAEPQARDLAIAYGLPYVIRQEKGPGQAVSGTSSGAAAAAGIPAITAEAGGCGLVEEHAVALHVTGLNAVLTVLGMTEAPLDRNPASPPTHLGRFLWLRSRHPGWWQPTITPGATLTEGQPIGTVTTLDGAEVLETITAPADCVVIFLTSSPAITADGLLIGLGAI